MSRQATGAQALDVRHVTAAYDDEAVLRRVDLRVAPGEMVAVLGPSGSGKSTLLSVVAGFMPVRDGEVFLSGALVSAPGRAVPPEQRRVGVVFQHYALWPHMTALETVSYPLRRRGARPDEARRRAQELLARMGIGELSERRPAQLSGGQQQRVGVARALAREPTLFLFDEPTAHLDTALRAALQDEVAEQRRTMGAAALYATHDAPEALAVADRIILLRAGEVIQAGTPSDVYDEPVDVWAARLTGAASVLRAPARDLGDGKVEVRIDSDTARVPGGSAAGAALRGSRGVLVRPEWAELGGPLSARVRRTRYRGAHTDYVLGTAVGELEVRCGGAPRLRSGDGARWGLRRAWIVPADEPAHAHDAGPR
jgi:ABC-type Fe3+/spermidine/putrescine transport system ATPase subunit